MIEIAGLWLEIVRLTLTLTMKREKVGNLFQNGR